MDADDVLVVLLQAREAGTGVCLLLSNGRWENGRIRDIRDGRVELDGAAVRLIRLQDIEDAAGRHLEDLDEQPVDELHEAGKILRSMSDLTLAEQMIASLQRNLH